MEQCCEPCRPASVDANLQEQPQCFAEAPSATFNIPFLRIANCAKLLTQRIGLLRCSQLEGPLILPELWRGHLAEGPNGPNHEYPIAIGVEMVRIEQLVAEQRCLMEG